MMTSTQWERIFRAPSGDCLWRSAGDLSIRYSLSDGTFPTETECGPYQVVEGMLQDEPVAFEISTTSCALVGLIPVKDRFEHIFRLPVRLDVCLALFAVLPPSRVFIRHPGGVTVPFDWRDIER